MARRGWDVVIMTPYLGAPTYVSVNGEELKPLMSAGENHSRYIFTNNRFVLKTGYPDQNRSEVDVWLRAKGALKRLLVPILAYDEKNYKWIIQKRVNLHRDVHVRHWRKLEHATTRHREFVIGDLSFMEDYDFKLARSKGVGQPRNWALVDGRPRIYDFGVVFGQNNYRYKYAP